MKIKATRKVRELLVELDAAFERFHANSRQLSSDGQRQLTESQAGDVGADQLAVKHLIIGIAWRINKASKGEE